MTELKDRQHVASAVPVKASGSPRSKLFRLARKELRESLRDRRTIMTLVLMPILVYPLLGLVVQRVALSRVPDRPPEALVAYSDNLPPFLLSQLIPLAERDAQRESEEEKPVQNESSSPGVLLAGVTGSDPTALSLTKVTLRYEDRAVPDDEASGLVAAGRVDVVIRLAEPWRVPEMNEPGPGPRFEVLARAGDSLSQAAADRIEGQLEEYRERVTEVLLRRAGYSVAQLAEWQRNTVQASGPTQSPLGTFVPLVLVLMTMTGAVYPAIDLTAGERERGTLEMLIASPVSRRLLLTAKFIAVCTVAMLTAVVNLTAMMSTLYAVGMDSLVFGESGLTAGVLFQTFLLLMVFASFFSAVLLCVTSFARSFKEAQAWLIPLMLVSLAPGIISLMPNFRLTATTALIPLVNIILLGRELFQGQAVFGLFVLTIAATLSYTWLALRMAGHLFGADSVLFAAGTRPVAGAAPKTGRPFVPPGTAWLVTGLLFPLMILGNGSQRLVSPENAVGHLLLSAVLTVGLMGILPIATVFAVRARFRTGLALRRPGFVSVLGAFLAGISLWGLVYELMLLAPMPQALQRLAEQHSEVADRIYAVPAIVRVLCLAVTAGICEELLFRGLLFSSLAGRTDPQARGNWKTVLITSAVFAAFHILMGDSLSPTRLLPSFLLGLALGTSRWLTGSVFPGMILHVANNSLLLLLKDLEPLLQRMGLDTQISGETHLPITWILGLSALSAVGLFLIVSGRQRPQAVADRAGIDRP